MSDKFQALYKAQIEALAAIVNVHTPDKLYGRDAIPRDPVMELVQKIRAALDVFTKESRLVLPDAQPVLFVKPDDFDNSVRGAKHWGAYTLHASNKQGDAYSVPLFTTPQPAAAPGPVALTDDAIDLVRCNTAIPQSTDSDYLSLSKAQLRVFARAIEAAHGIR